MSQLETVTHLLPNDPEHVLIALDLNRNADDEVYKVSLKSGFRKLIQREVDGAVKWQADPNGTLRLYSGIRGNRQLFRLKTPAGKWKDHDDFAWADVYRFEGFSADPNHIYAHRTGEHNRDELYLLDMMSGEVVDKLFSHPDYDMDHLVRDQHTGRVVGVAYTDHFQKTVYFDDSYKAVQQAVSALLPNDPIQIMSRDEEGNALYPQS